MSVATVTPTPCNVIYIDRTLNGCRKLVRFTSIRYERAHTGLAWVYFSQFRESWRVPYVGQEMLTIFGEFLVSPSHCKY